LSYDTHADKKLKHTRPHLSNIRSGELPVMNPCCAIQIPVLRGDSEMLEVG